jgi:POT family proton-dependent oligopeptide transporter
MSSSESTAVVEDYGHEDDLWGHPKGLYVCFATELWERFSFYGMKYLLLLYLTKYHLFSDSMGLDVLGAYAGLVYALPVIGGLLADRYLGMRKAVVFGGILLSCGHILMAVEGHEAVYYAVGTILSSDLTLADGTVLAAGTTLTEAITVRDTAALNVFYLAISLIVMGVGFLKPNISTIVGKLYHPDDHRRDSGFTIFYMGINIGSFAATLLCGWLGEVYGWKYGFGAAGIGMILGLITFLKYQKYLHGHAEPSNPGILKEKVMGIISKENFIYVVSVLFTGIIWLLVQDEPIVHAVQNSMLIVAITGIILYSMFHDSNASRGVATTIAVITVILGLLSVLINNTPLFGDVGAMNEYVVYATLLFLVVFVAYGFIHHNSAEYGRTVALMILIVSTIVFWALFEQSAGSMTLYADRILDRNFMGTEIRASQFGSLNAGFIMLLAIPFAALWTWLDKRNLEPNTAVKFGLGIIQAGLGFGALVIGAQFPNEAGKVAMIWLILAYLLHTTGELCLSPVGLSAVTKLSIPRVVGVSMGTWFLATALSETVATRIGKMAAIDTSAAGETASAAELLATYTNLYEFLMWLGLGVGIFMIIISPILKKWMHGVH